jgi:hypothetical protein
MRALRARNYWAINYVLDAETRLRTREWEDTRHTNCFGSAWKQFHRVTASLTDHRDHHRSVDCRLEHQLFYTSRKQPVKANNTQQTRSLIIF